jgi:hypothetical protein
MERERRFIQPSLQKPDMEDPMTWATLKKTQTQWWRIACPQLGLDTARLIKGAVLYDTIHDDGTPYMVNARFSLDPKKIALCKTQALERLDWELTTPETPEEVKVKLQAAQRIVADTDWSDKERFSKIEETRRNLVEEVKEIVDQDLALQDAITYRTDSAIKAVWLPYWNEFIGETEAK